MRSGIKYNYKKVTSEIMLIVANGINQNLPLKKIELQLKKDMSRFVGQTNRETNSLVHLGVDIARRMKGYRKLGIWEKMFSRRDIFDDTNRLARKVQTNIGLRWRRYQTRIALDTGVFFMCSIHQNPAKDHQDLQGKIYVNRYWRTMVDPLDYAKVSAYIRNHQVMTVQEVMGSPYWLTTRPYCRHWFIELDVGEVLNSSVGKIRKEVGVAKFTPYTSDNYYSERSQIYSSLHGLIPCQEFEAMSKK